MRITTTIAATSVEVRAPEVVAPPPEAVTTRDTEAFDDWWNASLTVTVIWNVPAAVGMQASEVVFDEVQPAGRPP